MQYLWAKINNHHNMPLALMKKISISALNLLDYNSEYQSTVQTYLGSCDKTNENAIVGLPWSHILSIVLFVLDVYGSL